MNRHRYMSDPEFRATTSADTTTTPTRTTPPRTTPPTTAPTARRLSRDQRIELRRTLARGLLASRVRRMVLR